MTVSCLLLSQACSALSWLDLGSQDNSTSGQHSGHCPARSTVMWFLHSDFTVSQPDFHMETGSVFYCSAHREQTAFLYLCWQWLPPVRIEINHKALCCPGGFSKNFPLTSYLFQACLCLLLCFQSWKRSVQCSPAVERARLVWRK